MLYYTLTTLGGKHNTYMYAAYLYHHNDYELIVSAHVHVHVHHNVHVYYWLSVKYKIRDLEYLHMYIHLIVCLSHHNRNTLSLFAPSGEG